MWDEDPMHPVWEVFNLTKGQVEREFRSLDKARRFQREAEAKQSHDHFVVQHTWVHGP